jgi:hypothetical protein
MESKFEIFLKKAIALHGDRYDYSKANYINAKTNITIICDIHGEFNQLPRVHLRGSGCQACALDKNRDSLSSVIDKFKNRHGNLYDYSKVVYSGAAVKVSIICPKHGEFLQTPTSHMSGNGCPVCANNAKLGNDGFIKKSIEKHGDKYDYSKVNYINNSTNVTIICPKHGEFQQKPNNHLNGKGCKTCAHNVNRYSLSDFITKAINKHGDKYSYVNSNYINGKTKVDIRCPIHGDFKQSAESHLAGHGCNLCASDSFRKPHDVFMSELYDIHGNNYDYSEVNYKTYEEPIKLICGKHGEFTIRPKHALRGQGCPNCVRPTSKEEKELTEFIKSLGLSVDENDRNILNGLEIDIYIPEANLAIEYDGIYWHSELFVDSNYHLNKTELCEAKGVRLIHIFEDEWKFKQDIVKSRLKNILGITENRVFARNCEIRLMTNDERNTFLDHNHLQGSVKSSVDICLTHEGEIVASMHFNKPRLGIGGRFNGYELSRFCNKLDTAVVGGASKLFKYFVSQYNPTEIRTYADKRWSQGEIYEKLGFNLSHVNKPNYTYVINNKRINRFNFSKKTLKECGYDVDNKTEHQIMLERSIYRVYDCGTISYKLVLS